MRINVMHINAPSNVVELLAGKYCVRIGFLFFNRETRFVVAQNYMANQMKITALMRVSVVAWLVQIDGNFKLLFKQSFSSRDNHRSFPILQLGFANKLVACCRNVNEICRYI